MVDLNTLLFPRCPKCGGPSESAVPDDAELSRLNRTATQVLIRERAMGRDHPWIQAGKLAFFVGREIHKRIPGQYGGKKRCTHCAHEFQ